MSQLTAGREVKGLFVCFGGMQTWISQVEMGRPKQVLDCENRNAIFAMHHAKDLRWTASHRLADNQLATSTFWRIVRNGDTSWFYASVISLLGKGKLSESYGASKAE